jgi:hypothetical protein
MTTFKAFSEEKPKSWEPILVTDFKDTTIVEYTGYGSLQPLGVSGHEWDWDFKSSQFTHWMYVDDLMSSLM